MDTLHKILIGTEPGLSPHEQVTLVPTDPASTAQALSPEQRRCLAAEAYQWLKQGIAQYRQGQYTPALALLQQALQTYRSLAHPSGEAKVLLTLASLYYQLADYLWSLDYARQSLAIARKIRDRSLTQQALSYLGNSYRHLKDLDKALAYTQQSLQAARALAKPAAEMRCLNNLAMIYRLQGEHQQAAELYEAGLLIAESLNDRITLEQLLRNLGNTYHTLGNHAKTTQYYQRLITLVSNAHQRGMPSSVDTDLLRRILGTLTKICRVTGNEAQAIRYLHQHLELARELRDIRSEEQILEQLAQSYEVVDQVEQALNCYEQRLQVLIQLQDPFLQQQAFRYFQHACLSYGEERRLPPYLRLFGDHQ